MQQHITACDSSDTALQTEAEPEVDYTGSAESVLIRIPDDMADALCAEPAIRKYRLEMLSPGQLTVCCKDADLYVGHPSVGGIMYDLPEDGAERYGRMIVLEAVEGHMDQRIGGYAAQLGVEIEEENPRIFLTSLDWIRIERFGLSKMNRPVVALVLSDEQPQNERFEELALELKEKHEMGVVFLSLKKQQLAETGKNLTGRLMSREMAAMLSKVDCWVSDWPAAEILGQTAESNGILLTDSESWDPQQVSQHVVELCEQELNRD